MKAKTMHIGELAREAGVPDTTIRYYERRGLLEPTRTLSNYRLYSPVSVRRVRFIRHAQELAFTLEEIKELLALRIDSEATCADVRERTEAKMGDIKDKIRALRAMHKTLKRLSEACSNGASASDCPILESFDSEQGFR